MKKGGGDLRKTGREGGLSTKEPMSAKPINSAGKRRREKGGLSRKRGGQRLQDLGPRGSLRNLESRGRKADVPHSQGFSIGGPETRNPSTY